VCLPWKLCNFFWSIHNICYNIHVFRNKNSFILEGQPLDKVICKVWRLNLYVFFLRETVCLPWKLCIFFCSIHNICYNIHVFCNKNSFILKGQPLDMVIYQVWRLNLYLFFLRETKVNYVSPLKIMYIFFDLFIIFIIIYMFFVIKIAVF
jgi:hypothetical protein